MPYEIDGFPACSQVMNPVPANELAQYAAPATYPPEVAQEAEDQGGPPPPPYQGNGRGRGKN